MFTLPRATAEADALCAAVWNRAAGELERLTNIQVAPPLELSDGPAGRRLSLRLRPDRLYWGVVQCHGPAGAEADYTDNRYWVALGYLSNSSSDGPTAPVTVTAYSSTDPRFKVITATNFFENNDTTHFVRPQTIVRLWAEYDHGSPAQLRWTMIVADEGTQRRRALLLQFLLQQFNIQLQFKFKFQLGIAQFFQRQHVRFRFHLIRTLPAGIHGNDLGHHRPLPAIRRLAALSTEQF